MFDIYLKINVPDKTAIDVGTSWQEKDRLGRLLCEYIPRCVSDVIPENDRYLIRWRSMEDYLNLLSDREYNDIIDIVKGYSVTVEWISAI